MFLLQCSFCPEYLIELGRTTGTCLIEITDFLIKYDDMGVSKAIAFL